MNRIFFLFFFFFSLFLSWLFLAVFPFQSLKKLPEIKWEDGSKFEVKKNGFILSGSEVYAGNGCFVCHTQVIRPTFIGKDLWREGWAGKTNDEDRGDTRRETIIFDFSGENIAQLGIMRMGPDLSNLGVRVRKYAKEAGVSPEDWLYRYLANPRTEAEKYWSNCSIPSNLFKLAPRNDKRSTFLSRDGKIVSPTQKAKVLVSYLLSLKRDGKVPKAIDYSSQKK